jgi:hypothetical protein
MPLLYFSLLPVDLNRYFYNKYLALECNVIWHQIYGWEDIRSPYLDAFHHYLAKSGYSGLYRDAKHFSNRCIQRGSISMIELQGPNSDWYSDWYRYQIQRPDGLVTWLERQGYKAHIPPDSRLNGTKILRCVFTSIEEIDKWENLHHAGSLEPIKPIMLDWIRTRSPDREALIQYAAKMPISISFMIWKPNTACRRIMFVWRIVQQNQATLQLFVGSRRITMLSMDTLPYTRQERAILKP